MKKHLYFICPTDHLEEVINSCFQQDNYFYSSLGNSMAFNDDNLVKIKELLYTKDISDITFILSNDNKIILDAIDKQSYLESRSLTKIYEGLAVQKKRLKNLWRSDVLEKVVLNQYLKSRIVDFKNNLCLDNRTDINIKAKVFSREQKVFKNVLMNFDYSAFVSLN